DVFARVLSVWGRLWAAELVRYTARLLPRGRSQMNQLEESNREAASGVIAARRRWLEASDHASRLASELFQLGDGYGDPDARAADEHRLQSARHEAERLFREYHDLDRRELEITMLKLQRSQQQATWASFVV